MPYMFVDIHSPVKVWCYFPYIWAKFIHEDEFFKNH